MKNKLCGAFLLVVAVLHCVLGDYVLRVQFHEYNNPTSSCPTCLTRGGNQRCCDGGGTCNGDDLCDNYFVSCFRAIGSTGFCITNLVISDTFDNNDSIELEAETEVSLTLTSPGAWAGVQLFTRVFDEDDSDDQFVDSFVIDLNTSFLVPGAGFTAQTVYNGVFGFGQLELSFRVSCAENFTGSDCSTECIPPNNQTICNEEGILVCQPPFFGPNCQLFDDCHLNDDCLPNGRCVDGDNTFTCDCDTGFTGANCMTNIDDCSGNDACGSNGQCVDGFNTFTCQCDNGFTGANCTTDINDCEGVDCGNGTCQDTGAVSFICQCDPGFTGEQCSAEIDECQGIDCSGNGQCIDELASFSCDCDAGFTGERCETNIYINGCASANCSENGQCVDLVNSFTCECSAGFTGTFCENQLPPKADSPENTNAIIGGAVGAVIGAIALVLILALVLVIVVRKLQHMESGTRVEEMATSEQRPSKHAEAAIEAEIPLSQNPVYGLGNMKMQKNQVYELAKTIPAETDSGEYDYVEV